MEYKNLQYQNLYWLSFLLGGECPFPLIARLLDQQPKPQQEGWTKKKYPTLLPPKSSCYLNTIDISKKEILPISHYQNITQSHTKLQL
ncbi:hypothetical protein SESBI_51041 [Sesbania bispinosa]|nr:hypothetical protein SESBI_51041 [Sesbania bispinosa]